MQSARWGGLRGEGSAEPAPPRSARGLRRSAWEETEGLTEVYLCPRTSEALDALKDSVAELFESRTDEDGKKAAMLNKAREGFCIPLLPAAAPGPATAAAPAPAGAAAPTYTGIPPQESRGPSSTITALPNPRRAAIDRGVVTNDFGIWWQMLPRCLALPTLDSGLDFGLMSHTNLCLLAN